jgi:transposase
MLGGVVMDAVLSNCAGLDGHKKFVVAARRWLDASGQVHTETRRFSTMTRDLEALAAWLVAAGCTDVVLESTGVYWQPIYNVLEGHVEVWLVNADHVKQVPGRKTDLKDAEWLAQLLQYGLVRRSFIPDREQRELGDLVRYRQSVVEERNRVANRLQKVLEDANLKLASVATNIEGVSAQEILRTLPAGETDPKILAELARGQLRKKQAALEQALTGRLRAHHRFLLAQLLGHLDFLDSEISALDERVEELVRAVPAWAAAVERLDTIPGINRIIASLIVAEIGVDMQRFPTARHVAAWAGVAPGNNETGGKQRATSTRKGNKVLRRALVQAAKAAARKKGSYLKALYHRLAARRGKKRATMAVAHALLDIAYHLIAREQTDQDLGGDYFDRLDRERVSRRLVQRLERLGFDVQLVEHVVEAQPPEGGEPAWAA